MRLAICHDEVEELMSARSFARGRVTQSNRCNRSCPIRRTSFAIGLCSNMFRSLEFTRAYFGHLWTQKLGEIARLPFSWDMEVEVRLLLRILCVCYIWHHLTFLLCNRKLTSNSRGKWFGNVWRSLEIAEASQLRMQLACDLHDFGSWSSQSQCIPVWEVVDGTQLAGFRHAVGLAGFRDFMHLAFFTASGACFAWGRWFLQNMFQTVRVVRNLCEITCETNSGVSSWLSQQTHSLLLVQGLPSQAFPPTSGTLS